MVGLDIYKNGIGKRFLGNDKDLTKNLLEA